MSADRRVSTLSRIRSAYRGCVPEPFRRRVRKVIDLASRSYSDRYFSYIDEHQQISYAKMAASIMGHFAPASVIDAGCGSGGLLLALKRAGVADCRGLEFSKAGRKACRKKGLNVVAGDFTQACEVDPTLDLAICCEVAEHLPEASADRLVANLAAGPDLLLFSAATPGQGGFEHLNEQENEYWISKFERHGFGFDEQMTHQLRAEWNQQGVVRWYANNIMAYRRSCSR